MQLKHILIAQASKFYYYNSHYVHILDVLGVKPHLAINYPFVFDEYSLFTFNACF